MKYKFGGLVLAVLSFFVCTLTCSLSWAEDLERMNTDAYETPTRPAAVFSHDEHNEMAEIDDCAVCHHVYEGKTLIEDESSEDSFCSDCHELKKTPENSVPLTQAYHKRCKTCHFEKNKGPVLCGQCHSKTK